VTTTRKRSLDLTWLAVLLAAGAVACAEEGESIPAADAPTASSGGDRNGTGGGDRNGTGTSQNGDATGNPAGGGPTPAPEPRLGPLCDDDNPLVDKPTDGSTDRMLPDEILQWERRRSWGCLHRKYHDTRAWDYVEATPAQAERLTYAKKVGWTRASIQEGEPGTGLDFLALHRAMLRTLKTRFPAHAKQFEGWATPPLVSTDADPLPPMADGKPQAAFRPASQAAITRIETDLGSFTTEDELGLYIDTQHRPVAGNPTARSPDTSTGVHTYLHIRYDDARSPIRMQRFARNLESVVFFRVHGWVDRIWTKYRSMKSLDDKTDATYRAEMREACGHLGFKDWDGAKDTCTD
jgi:hypothetical protein